MHSLKKGPNSAQAFQPSHKQKKLSFKGLYCVAYLAMFGVISWFFFLVMQTALTFISTSLRFKKCEKHGLLDRNRCLLKFKHLSWYHLLRWESLVKNIFLFFKIKSEIIHLTAIKRMEKSRRYSRPEIWMGRKWLAFFLLCANNVAFYKEHKQIQNQKIFH